MRWAAIWLTVLGGAGAWSQSVTGTVAGVVRDPHGAAIVGARVTARSTATNAQTVQSSNDEGFYRAANLVPGSYIVEVEAKGFRKTTVSPQEIGAADVLRLDVTLEIGQLAESVTVESSAVEINTEDAQSGKTMREISDLPLLSGDSGRNVLSLVGTQPGVVTGAPNASGISVGGQRTGSNNFMLDGGDSNETLLATSDAVQSISPNAVSEFRVITGAMKAEYGRNSGAVVLVTTKSGGNAFHGIASETFRNTRLNATPFFLNAVPGGTTDRFADGSARKPQWNGNDFDVNAGGPIRKDKTFFFVSYLGFRRLQGVENSATVPTDGERAAIDAQGRPEARAILALIPHASSGDTLISAPVDSQTRNQGLAKVDHSFSQANRLSATYFIDDQADLTPFPNGNGANGTMVPGFGSANDTRWQNLVLRDTHSFSARVFQEFRLSLHRRGDLLGVPLNHTSLRSLGLSGIVPDNPSLEGPPRIVINGIGSFGNQFNPRSFKRNNYQAVDNVSWVRGRHDLKFGAEYRKYFPNNISSFYNTGQITIDGSGTNNGAPLVPLIIPGLSAPLNDFANGYATSFTQQSTNRRAPRSHSINLFAQDDWKVRTNLTLNLGLRWEYNSGETDVRNQLVALRPGAQSVVFPDAPTGLVYPSDPNISDSTYRDDWNNFGPRFGFAWDPLKNGKVSVRGGYALLYDVPTNSSPTGLPFAITTTVQNASYANPFATSLTNPISQPFPFQPATSGHRFDFTRFGTLTFGAMDPNFATPYAQEWSLQVQSRIRRNWLVEAGYLGSAGTRLFDFREGNPAIPGPGATTNNTDRRRVLNQNNPQDAQFNGAVFGSILTNLTDANSNYHSLQVSVTRHFAGGLQMSQAYTWAHSIDNTSGLPGGVASLATSSSIRGGRADRGNSGFDVRQRYVGRYLYELPWGRAARGARRRVLAGWGVSGITTFQSGLPFNITEPADRCLCSSGGQRPDYIGGAVQFFDPRSSAAGSKPNQWFDPTRFQRVGTGTSYALGAGRFGTLGRDVFHGPGINNWDLAAFKRVLLAENSRLEFRVELLNAVNHSQFSDPVTSIADADFGRLRNTRDPRVVQLSMRIGF
jgi:outer membrane receptor protein involved in Fe transport